MNHTFKIVLFQPEIPLNTGNIGRLCINANAELHIIKPMRFFLDDKHIKRAGMDYWKDVKLTLHDNWQAFNWTDDGRNIYYCSTKATNLYHQQTYNIGDAFVFGPESRGLPADLLNQNASRAIKIPMHTASRSINLANSVAIILYEALRQIDFEMGNI